VMIRINTVMYFAKITATLWIDVQYNNYKEITFFWEMTMFSYCTSRMYISLPKSMYIDE